MNLSYFIVTCEEVDMFDGKITHVNEKAKDIGEVYRILSSYIDKYPTANWGLFPCHIEM